MSNSIEDIITFNKEENKLYFNKNYLEKLINLLNNLKDENESEENKKKETLQKLKEIFIEYKEISIIIISSFFYDENNQIDLIEILIDIYLKNENLREVSKDLLKYLLENITIEKRYYDYIYFKIGFDHRKNNLNVQKLSIYIKLLLLFYGKEIENKKFFPKRYLFFLNPNESIIKTNITKENKLFLRNNFSIYISFLIDKYSNNENCDLIGFTLENEHNLNIKLNQNIIKVYYDNDKCYEKLNLEINLNEWIILKFNIEENENNENSIMNLSIISYKKNINDDNYILNEEKKSCEFEIKKKLIYSISFLRNFKGKLLYIFSTNQNLFQENNNENMNLIFGKLNKLNLDKIKINNKDFNFIFSPFLFNEKNFEIFDPCQNYKCYLIKPENNFYQNYIYNYHNFRKNIFFIGNINCIIPLFEFLYLSNKEREEEKKIQIDILNDLFYLIEILNESNKNIIIIKDSKFYKIISFFIEKIEDEILNQSYFLEFIINFLKKNDIILNDNNLFKYILFNFNLFEKLTDEKKEKLFSTLFLSNIYEKIIDNFSFSNILINMTNFNVISSNMRDILVKLYAFYNNKEKEYEYEKKGITYISKLLCIKYHEELINLLFQIIEYEFISEKCFLELIKESFRDTIILFFINEKRIKMQMEFINLIKLLTEKYSNQLNGEKNKKEINQLTNFLIYFYKVESFPDNLNKSPTINLNQRTNKKLDIYFIESMNIIYRYIFIELVNIKEINNITLIDPYKIYNDNFIYSLIRELFQFKFPDNYADNVLNNYYIYHQFIKFIYYQIILYDNSENNELKNQINIHKNYFLKKIKLHQSNYFLKESIKKLKQLLFESFIFSIKERNKNIIKPQYSIELLYLFLSEFKINLYPYIFNLNQTYSIKNPNDNNNIYNFFFNQLNDFINEYNKHINNQILKIDFKNENTSFLEEFVTSCIISKKGELIFLIKNEVMYKCINNILFIFDYQTFEFFCHYFLININKVKLNDYIIIILVYLIPLCSNIDRKYGHLKYKNNLYSNDIKKKFRKILILLLKLIYIKSIIDEKSEFDKIFNYLNILIIKINNVINEIPNNFFSESPFNEINNYINNKLNICLFLNQKKKYDDFQILGASNNDTKIKYEINMKEIIQKLFEKKLNKNIIFDIPIPIKKESYDNIIINNINDDNNIEQNEKENENEIKDNQIDNYIKNEKQNNINNKNKKKNNQYNKFTIDYSLIKNKKTEIYNKNQLSNLSKLKLYRKIKKELFIWNGSYSDKTLFFKEINNQTSLKFKKSNHLTKDLSQPILIPMIYSYNFEELYCNQKFFLNDKNNFYIIPTPEIKNFTWILNTNFFHIQNISCCIIFLTNHIKGNLIFKKNCFKFIGNINEKINCYGSTIKSKKNTFYLKLYYNELKMILKRRYYDQNLGIEIYTKRNKSYYFIFLNENDRNSVLNSILKYLPKKIIIKNKTIELNIGLTNNNNSIDLIDIINNWQKQKISTYNFIMYLNILSNRSYRDVLQYPIFPWIINDYEISIKIPKKEKIKTYDIEIIKNKLIKYQIRDFNTPIGLIELNEKGIRRKYSYINSYISTLDSIIDDLKLNNKYKKIKDIYKEILIINQQLNERIDNEKNNINEITSSMNATSFSDIINSIKKPTFINNNIIFDLKNFAFEDDLYEIIRNEITKKNLKYDIISFPSLFGCHYSNSAYVSHYLTRIFPFTKIAIEIQGNNFDAADRLFINLEKTYKSVTSEKSDIREIIPEFFFLPEMFININNLKLGKLQKVESFIDRKSTYNILKNFLINNNENIIENNNNKNIENNNNNNYEIKVNNVLLPYWCKNNPYLFITIYRNLLEKTNTKIGKWIDLIFGINSQGKNAQNHLNLFARYSYPNIINNEINKNEYDKEEKESLIKMAELGMNPIQILFDECKNNKTLNYEKIINDIINEYQKNHFIKNIYDLKSEQNYFDIINFIKSQISKIIICKFKNNIILFTGLLNGKIYLYKNKKMIFEDLNKTQNQIKDNSRITCFNNYYEEFDTSFLFFGTEKGSILIYKNEFLKKEIEYYNIINYHTKEIISIDSNTNLNILIDSSYDGYINLYLIPSFNLIRSIFFNPNLFIIEKVFLSSNPLSCFLIFTNEKEFKCFSINGKEIYNEFIEEDFINPQIITGDNFIDYLIYEGNKNNFSIFIRQFPYLGIVEKKNIDDDNY